MTVQKAEATPDPISESKVDAVTRPAPEINSVPKTEVKAESLPGLPKPLSPYPIVMSQLPCSINFSLPVLVRYAYGYGGQFSWHLCFHIFLFHSNMTK